MKNSISMNTEYKLYGYEDYACFAIDSSVFDEDYMHCYFYPFQGTLFPVNGSMGGLEQLGDNIIFDVSNIYDDHIQLLQEVKRVFVHPSCSISRTLLSQKYKRGLTPWDADVVVVPNSEQYNIGKERYAVFVNDECKIVLTSSRMWNDLIEMLRGATGKCFRELIKEADKVQTPSKIPDTYVDGILNATLEGIYDCLFVPKNNTLLYDELTGNIPKNKTVFESTIMESLSSTENQVTLDSLLSIKEMLDSNDENTQATALKALSMLDYMHYPNSVRRMLETTDSCNWKYIKAADSAPVKYMLQTLFGKRWRKAYKNYDDSIFPQDFEIFKQLVPDIFTGKNDYYLYRYPFIDFDEEGRLDPILRQ